MAVHKDQQTRMVRSLRGGQITIPSEFRRQLGIEADSLLQLTVADGELRIRPVRVAPERVGSPWLKELYDLFAPVREDAERKGYTEDEINADIDAAVKAVRERHA